MHRLAQLAFTLTFALALAHGAASPAPTPGLVLLVAPETVGHTALRDAITERVGEAERVELHLTRSNCTRQGPRHLCLAPEDPRADDPELARALREARVIELRGGEFMPWYDTLLPPKEQSRAAAALRAAWREGAHVIAYGAAASFAAGAGVIPRAALEEPARNPREEDPLTGAVGLALGPPAFVDARGWQVGDPLALLRQMWRFRVDLGFFLEGEVALCVRFAPHRVEVLGPGSALLVDLQRARRQKRALLEGRLAVLGQGDVWDFPSKRVVPVPGAPEGPDGAVPPQAPRVNLLDHTPGPLDLCDLVRDLPSFEGRRRALQLGPRSRLSLREDGATRWWLGERQDLRAAGVAFDLFWE